MKLHNVVQESFKSVSINGILYSLNNDETELYNKVKKENKVMKSYLDEFTQRIASNMVSKGLLRRKKDKQSNIYFTTRGRRKVIGTHPLDEVAPPDRSIEKWIGDNKERFKEKYGKDYGKYLYGKAWNKFNGKKSLKENDNMRIIGDHMEMSPGEFYNVTLDNGQTVKAMFVRYVNNTQLWNYNKPPMCIMRLTNGQEVEVYVKQVQTGNNTITNEGYVKKVGVTPNGFEYNDDYIEFEVGMRFIDDEGVTWEIVSVKPDKYDENDKIIYIKDENGNIEQESQVLLNVKIVDETPKYRMIFDPKFFNEDDGVDNYEYNKHLSESELQEILDKHTLTEVVTGYHGSPYDFDKFDVKFIGSGQGAIAHGWGLYFAIEDPRTAKGYKDNYTRRPGSYVSYSFEKKSYPKGSVMFRVLKLIKKNGKEAAIDSLNDLLKQKEWIESNPSNEEYVKQLIEKIDKIDEDKIKEKIHVNKGQRFTVKLPNLTNFLDEQKNMSEQSKKVQSVMKKIAKDKKIDIYDSINGRDFYYKLGNLIQSSNDWDKAKYASQLLYQHGVVGIKYNGYSDGECVVMFNGDDVKIMKKEINVEKDTVQLPMLHKIMEDPHLLKTIENPSDEIILAALKEDLTTIQYVENPSDEVKDFVIEQNWSIAINYIKEFNEKQVEKLLEISNKNEKVILKCWYMIDDTELDKLLKYNPDAVILIFNNSFDLSEELQAKAYDLLYYILLRNDINDIDNIIESSDYDRELLTTYLNEKGETYIQKNHSSLYHVFKNILSALAPSVNEFDQLARNMILFGTQSYDYLDELKVEDIDFINDCNIYLDTLIVKDTCIIKEDALVEFIGLVMNSISSIQSNIYDRLSVDKKIDICLKKKNYISYFIQHSNVKELNEYLNNDVIRNYIFKEKYHISNYIVEEYFLQLDKDIQYKVLQSFYWDRDFNRIQIFKKLFQDNKDVNIQKIIFRTNLPLMKYINNIDEKIQMKMIEKNPFNIKYINNASPKVIEKATSMNPQVKDYIR